MLTDEQRRFAELPTEAFVEACPGAGKTRTIVARVKRLTVSLPPRQGVAVLSFTNSAVDAFTKRCCEDGVSHVLRLPHFVGTFDAFVRHFLVLPYGVSACSGRPVIVDSWKSLGVDIRLSGQRAFGGDGVSLDRFHPETNVIDPTRITHAGLRAHVMTNQQHYQNAAAYRRAALHRAGYLTAEDARVEGHKRIQDAAKGDAIGRALRSRFTELIVDEAQDCNPLDLAILTWLRGHGLRVTVVCDPDQAIYGFRHGTPNELRSFAEPYGAELRPNLTGNFRSSQPITLLAATLRSRSEADNPLGETAHLTHPVVIATYTGAKVPAGIGRLFLERMEANGVGLSHADGIVLAHKGSDARRAANDSLAEEPGGQSRIEALARAVGEFWSPSADQRTRHVAVRAAEKLLLQLLKHWGEDDHHTNRVVERAKLDARRLRRDALAMLMRLPKTCADTNDARTGWVATVKTEVAALNLSLPAGASIAQFFRCPPGSSCAIRHEKPPLLHHSRGEGKGI